MFQDLTFAANIPIYAKVNHTPPIRSFIATQFMR